MPFEEVRAKMKIAEPVIYKKYAAEIHAKDKDRIAKLKTPMQEAA
jgi:hypothetical protein